MGFCFDRCQIITSQRFFCDDRVQITSAGRRYLGGAIGCPDSLRGYIWGIDSKWLEHLERLTTFAASQPQAAYAAFVHSLSAKSSYFQRMIHAEQSGISPRNRRSRTSFCRHWRVRAPYLSIPDISSLSLLVWAALETAIRWPQVRTSIEHQAAVWGGIYSCLPSDECTCAIRKEREKGSEALRSHGNISSRRLDLLQEKGTSSWLTVIPVDDHDLFLHKGELRDAQALQ